ncbi:MAG TPA: hypothetical protein VMW19_14475 [Myxococcota bacterium]|nr:hypothetical protein [Myxococcota bacterium]
MAGGFQAALYIQSFLPDSWAFICQLTALFAQWIAGLWLLAVLLVLHEARPQPQHALHHRAPDAIRRPGTSDGPISPCRRQPTRRSQVRGVATQGGSREESGWSLWVQPSNHAPEDASSIFTGGVPDLARRAQRADVVAAEEHGAAAPEYAMDAARDARCDRLHRGAESTLVFRLEDQIR